MYVVKGSISILLFCFFLTGCTEEPAAALSQKDRAMIDTLYSQRVQVLRVELDSLCDAIFDEEVQAAVDSMLEVRRAEEEQLRRRIPLNLGEQ